MQLKLRVENLTGNRLNLSWTSRRLTLKPRSSLDVDLGDTVLFDGKARSAIASEALNHQVTSGKINLTILTNLPTAQIGSPPPVIKPRRVAQSGLSAEDTARSIVESSLKARDAAKRNPHFTISDPETVGREDPRRDSAMRATGVVLETVEASTGESMRAAVESFQGRKAFDKEVSDAVAKRDAETPKPAETPVAPPEVEVPAVESDAETPTPAAEGKIRVSKRAPRSRGKKKTEEEAPPASSEEAQAVPPAEEPETKKKPTTSKKKSTVRRRTTSKKADSE